MFEREKIEQILDCARAVDKKYELFGTSTHKYKLNPPIQASFVRTIEEKYGFTLPEDYFYFITEVADGGAGPDYGIHPLRIFCRKVRIAIRNDTGKSIAIALPNHLPPDQWGHMR